MLKVTKWRAHTDYITLTVDSLVDVQPENHIANFRLTDELQNNAGWMKDRLEIFVEPFNVITKRLANI